jgi:hypothetical protein
LNSHEFLVLERDGKGLGDGSKAVMKQLWAVDIAGATDVSDLSGETALLAFAAPKILFLDIAAEMKTKGFLDTQIPSKLEGIAFGSDIVDNGSVKHTLYLGNDNDFVPDVANGTLPAVSFVKAVMYKNEHPGYGNTISKGVTFATGVTDKILKSPTYSDNTLVLLTWDEGGGFYDHVAPPPTSVVDNQPYGTRVPLLAIGKFAKKGFVSHVTMEHSSIVKFIEWNWLGKQTGQDAALGKTTFVTQLGIDGAKKRVRDLLAKADSALSIFGAKGDVLRAAARFVAERKN